MRTPAILFKSDLLDKIYDYYRITRDGYPVIIMADDPVWYRRQKVEVVEYFKNGNELCSESHVYPIDDDIVIVVTDEHVTVTKSKDIPIVWIPLSSIHKKGKTAPYRVHLSERYESYFYTFQVEDRLWMPRVYADTFTVMKTNPKDIQEPMIATWYGTHILFDGVPFIVGKDRKRVKFWDIHSRYSPKNFEMIFDWKVNLDIFEEMGIEKLPG